MKYSNQPILNSAVPALIEFQPTKAPKPLKQSSIDLNVNWSNNKTTADWLGKSLNRPMAKSNRALREFAKRSLA